MKTENFNVLIVDDHMIMRNILRGYLGATGIKKVSEATNGKEALLKIEDAEKAGSPFNVILADWSMPVMDGLSFLKTIRGNKKYDNLAFVMITAESEKEKIMEALQAGVTSYLVKPFTQEDLQSHVKKIQDWLTAKVNA
jgi:two-component system chemotaxis response regulator CheY